MLSTSIYEENSDYPRITKRYLCSAGSPPALTPQDKDSNIILLLLSITTTVSRIIIATVVIIVRATRLQTHLMLDK